MRARAREHRIPTYTMPLYRYDTVKKLKRSMHIIAADADASQILLISTDNPRIDLDSREQIDRRAKGTGPVVSNFAAFSFLCCNLGTGK